MIVRLLVVVVKFQGIHYKIKDYLMVKKQILRLEIKYVVHIIQHILKEPTKQLDHLCMGLLCFLGLRLEFMGYMILLFRLLIRSKTDPEKIFDK